MQGLPNMETNCSHRPELNIYFNLINIEKDKGIVRLININNCIFISARIEFWFLIFSLSDAVFEGRDLHCTQNAFVKLNVLLLKMLIHQIKC